MKTALTVLATVILTAIAILAGTQSGILPIGINSSVCQPDGTGCEPMPTGRSCASPRATTVAHGKSILSFGSPTGDVQQGCNAETSTCNNGEWLNNKSPLKYATCEISLEKNCEINGNTIAHGATRAFYTEGEIVNGQWVCIVQDRSCNDGVANGDDQYIYATCETRTTVTPPTVQEPTPPVVPQPPLLPTNEDVTVTTPTEKELTSTEDKSFNCPSPWGGTTWEPNRSQTVYLQSAVLENETCESTTVVCAYGSIRYGTPENIGEAVQVSSYPTCGVREPASCTSLCGSVGNGETIASYSTNNVGYSSSISCADVKITSTCNDGLLTPAAGDYCSCTVADPAVCTAPGDIQIPHGGSLTLYQSAEVQALPGDGSDTCVRQRRECGDGVWHDANGSASDFTFQYTSCTVLPPPSGGGAGGEGVPQ